MIVVEEHGSGRRLLPFHGCYRRAVDEINVEPAVVVVIEEGDAGAGGFDDGGLLRCAGTVMKFVEGGLLGCVEEDDRGVVDEPAGGDGAMEGVANCGVGAPGGHASGLEWRRILGRFGNRLLAVEAESEREDGEHGAYDYNRMRKAGLSPGYPDRLSSR
jgi:hypothetical protein